MGFHFMTLLNPPKWQIYNPFGLSSSILNQDKKLKKSSNFKASLKNLDYQLFHYGLSVAHFHLIYNIFFTRNSMGSSRSKMSFSNTSYQVDDLCSLITSSVFAPYSLSFNPFPSTQFKASPFNNEDFPISSMVDEGQETQTPVGLCATQTKLPCSPTKPQAPETEVQKNQFQQNQHRNSFKMGLKQKESLIIPGPQENPEQYICENQNKETLEEGIRDQNNCKTYHKLVKNYLIENGQEDKIMQYESKYHTRYYFLISLMIIKYYLKVDFVPVYEDLVRIQVQTQKKKIFRKENELSKLRSKISFERISCEEKRKLKLKEGKLIKQIHHINVVIHEIKDYSMRSCRAFFQVGIEESLRILYLKNDPVMRKKYYFEEALETIVNFQSLMRKSSSHS